MKKEKKAGRGRYERISWLYERDTLKEKALKEKKSF